MKLELQSILNCEFCNKQDQEKVPFTPGDDAERVARILEEKLVRKHTDENPDCMSSLEITTTSKIVNKEKNEVVRIVKSGLDIEGTLSDLDPEINEDFLGDHSEFPDDPASCIGHLCDF